MRKYEVVLDPDFVGGELNTVVFKDLPYLNEQELQSLSDFVDAVSKGNALKGKNKPSWLNDEQDEIPFTSSYKKHNFWHYHCGPTYSDAKISSLTYNLSLNIDGVTSSEVIHYSKEGTKITVHAYSPKHTPFPLSDEPDNKNPLFHEE